MQHYGSLVKDFLGKLLAHADDIFQPGEFKELVDAVRELHQQAETLDTAFSEGKDPVEFSYVFSSMMKVLGGTANCANAVGVALKRQGEDIQSLKDASDKWHAWVALRRLVDWITTLQVQASHLVNRKYGEFLDELDEEYVDHEPGHWSEPLHAELAMKLPKLGLNEEMWDYLYEFKNRRHEEAHEGVADRNNRRITKRTVEKKYEEDRAFLQAHPTLIDTEKLIFGIAMTAVKGQFLKRKNPVRSASPQQSAQCIASPQQSA